MVNREWTPEEFRQLLAKGKEGEHIVKHLLITRWRLKAEINEDPATRKFWDIHTPLGMKFEVKYQERALEYGSVFIETMEGKERSGLTITHATWWVNVLPDRAVFTPVRELREFIGRHRGMQGVKPVADAGFSGTAKGWKVDNRYFTRQYMGVVTEPF